MAPRSRHGSSLSATTRLQVRRAGGELATTATRRIEERYGWYADLTARQRSWVAQVAQAGISGFIEWVDGHGRQDPRTTFAAAPRELTRAITLAQTLELSRTVIEVVDAAVEDLATAGDVPALREAVLRYSTEVAFGAAQVYATAAEQRGAWDARLESLVIDAVMRGEMDDSLLTRAAALGWDDVHAVVVIVGESPHVGDPTTEPAEAAAALHRAAARLDHPALAGVQGGRLVAVLGGVADPARRTATLAGLFGPGPLVHGTLVEDLVEGAISAAAAVAGHDAAHGWAGCPRPVAADDLLAERTLVGDELARASLVARIHEPLLAHPALLQTARTYLDSSAGLEGTARELIVHVNTVRYRLRRIAEITGYEITDPHDAFTVRVALTLGTILEGSSKDPA